VLRRPGGLTRRVGDGTGALLDDDILDAAFGLADRRLVDDDVGKSLRVDASRQRVASTGHVDESRLLLHAAVQIPETHRRRKGCRERRREDRRRA
jgi:hypothetical protein